MRQQDPHAVPTQARGPCHAGRLKVGRACLAVPPLRARHAARELDQPLLRLLDQLGPGAPVGDRHDRAAAALGTARRLIRWLHGFPGCPPARSLAEAAALGSWLERAHSSRSSRGAPAAARQAPPFPPAAAAHHCTVTAVQRRAPRRCRSAGLAARRGAAAAPGSAVAAAGAVQVVLRLPRRLRRRRAGHARARGCRCACACVCVCACACVVEHSGGDSPGAARGSRRAGSAGRTAGSPGGRGAAWLSALGG